MLSDHPLLNSALVGELAACGHGDLVVIADAGLPVPAGVRLIDLALVPGVPAALAVLTVVAHTLVAEEAMITDECPADLAQHVRDRMPVQVIDHETLKGVSSRARVIIRTGECTPYANVVLVAGVSF